uniref:Uncharacterized protein n=1 Tax=Anguilla anguilla TaxID=7936 RepID=A0A0E9SCC0_ANGAN
MSCVPRGSSCSCNYLYSKVPPHPRL